MTKLCSHTLKMEELFSLHRVSLQLLDRFLFFLFPFFAHNSILTITKLFGDFRPFSTVCHEFRAVFQKNKLPFHAQ